MPEMSSIDVEKTPNMNVSSPKDDGTVSDPALVLEVNAAIEKKIVRKFDLYIIPLLAVMYLFNSIDKANLGNAKTDGFTTDLHFKTNQYSLLLTIFFIPLVLFATPIGLLIKRFGACYVLPCEMIIFGSMTMASAATHNFGQITAIRVIIGASESAFLPGVIFYLTTFYKRAELARRLCCFYAGAQIAGAFSGLIAYGIFQVKNGALHGWQYLFIIEGAITLLIALIALVALPRSAARAYFLSEEERIVARVRLEMDSSNVVDAKFSFREAIQVFKQNKLWPVWAAIGFCLCVPLFSVGTFLPQIVARFGYSPVKTNLYTVAPNIVGACFVIGLAFSSDYFKERCIHIACAMCVTLTGFIILAAVDIHEHYQIGYFACFLVAIGGFVTSPLWSSWYSNNTPGENQRAILTPFLVAFANCSAFVASNIFTDQSAPDYKPASITCASFGLVGACMVLSLGTWMRYDNNRRNKEQGVMLRAGDVPTSEVAGWSKDPRWRWMGVIG